MSVPNGWIKIGVAHNSVKRQRSLQTGNHQNITFLGATLISSGSPVAAYAFENLLHRRLERYRARGEWFKITLEELLPIWASAFRYLATRRLPKRRPAAKETT